MKNQSGSPKKNPQGKPDRAWEGYARYSGLAFRMFAIIALGILAGYKADQWLELKFPVFTVLLSVLSVGAAIYTAVIDLLRKK